MPLPRHPSHACDAQQATAVLMSMMDAIAELFVHAHRSERCSEEDGSTIVAMVKESHVTLWGITNGFAATNLLASMTQGPEDVR